MEYEYIDLELPSRRLWCTKNIGAETETDTGLYFGWGETEGYTQKELLDKGQFSIIDNYKLVDEDSGTISKYYQITDNKVLNSEDDAASVNMGKRWHMPSQYELEELIVYTIPVWEENYNDSGVNGIRLISKNNDTKSIFFPVTGAIIDGRLEMIDEICVIWSSQRETHRPQYAFCSGCNKDSKFSTTNDFRWNHHPIRGVRNPF